MLFESFVNSERCKTNIITDNLPSMFESFVNSERCKTIILLFKLINAFESFVNSERCKTIKSVNTFTFSLRALLIQKDVKQRAQRL